MIIIKTIKYFYRSTAPHYVLRRCLCKADTPIKLMFAGMQLAVLLRVLADMLPMQASHWLYFAAAAVWLACFTPWVLRYLPVYWRVRADRQAGCMCQRQPSCKPIITMRILDK